MITATMSTMQNGKQCHRRCSASFGTSSDHKNCCLRPSLIAAISASWSESIVCDSVTAVKHNNNLNVDDDINNIVQRLGSIGLAVRSLPCCLSCPFKSQFWLRHSTITMEMLSPFTNNRSRYRRFRYERLPRYAMLLLLLFVLLWFLLLRSDASEMPIPIFVHECYW